MSLNSSATVEKVKYVGDHLEELKESVAYTLDRVQLLRERLMPLLGNEVPTLAGDKRDAEFPLGQQILNIKDTSKSANDLLDDIISRLRV